MAKTEWTLVQFPNLPESSDPAIRDAIQLLFKGLKDHADAFTSLKSQLTTVQNTTSQPFSSGVTGVTSGGTGAQSLATNGVLIGQGANPVQAVLPSASGGVLTSNGTGANPSFKPPIIYEPMADGAGDLMYADLGGGVLDIMVGVSR